MAFDWFVAALSPRHVHLHSPIAGLKSQWRVGDEHIHLDRWYRILAHGNRGNAQSRQSQNHCGMEDDVVDANRGNGPWRQTIGKQASADVVDKVFKTPVTDQANARAVCTDCGGRW